MAKSGADVILTQEVKVPDDLPKRVAEQAARNLKWKVAIEPCHVTPAGGRSAGTAVATNGSLDGYNVGLIQQQDMQRKQQSDKEAAELLVAQQQQILAVQSTGLTGGAAVAAVLPTATRTLEARPASPDKSAGLASHPPPRKPVAESSLDELMAWDNKHCDIAVDGGGADAEMDQ